MQRTILIVDDEENIVRALKRLLRQDSYIILTANSGEDGLNILNEHPDVGVIISDQRMPQMSGVEFLNKVKQRFPDNVRIVLSGYTDLQSVTDAINHGAIYRFLTKPWEDDLLRKHISEAFHHYELARENERLNMELQQSNEELAQANSRLIKSVNINLKTLEVAQEILENLPLGVVGIANDGMIALSNKKAQALLGTRCGLFVGSFAEQVLPPEIFECYQNYLNGKTQQSLQFNLTVGDIKSLSVEPLGRGSLYRGVFLLFMTTSPETPNPGESSNQ